MKKWIAFLLAAVLLAGCSMPTQQPEGATEIAPTQQSGAEPTTGQPATLSQLDVESLFSNRDRKTEYSVDARILLEGGNAKSDDHSVQISGTTVTITREGVYELSGTLTDGTIVVDAAKSDKVQLVLNNAHITATNGAAVHVKQADKVFLTLVGENSLKNGGSFSDGADAAVYAKDDLTINGTGSVQIASPAGHGISAKDELTITGGSFRVECAEHGLDANDSVAIDGGSFVIDAGKDGIHAENNDDAAKGYVYIATGSFAINAQGDGISAGSVMQLDDGSYTITTGGGAANAEKKTSDGWGGFGGRPGGGKGGKPGGGFGGQQSENEDSASIKGIKAGGDLLIGGGSFTIDSADDAVHSNGALTVNGGSFAIASGDDGLHADGALTVSAGSIAISQSYEGLEGLSVTVNGGQITLKASDDGINAAGGADGSGFGGFRGGDKFGRPGGGSSDSFISITGGTLYIQASGDGVDANGDLKISGGHTTLCGPTRGDTAVLDYDMTGTITGGTFVGTGSSMMAQSFTSSEQGVVALRTGSQAANTTITLADGNGKVLLEYSPVLEFEILIISMPEMVKGEKYTVTVGQQSKEFTAN